jgi:two-component system response regulator NreC
MTTIPIVLAENHVIVRQGVRALLEADPELRVVGEAADADQAVELAQQTRPRVIILGLLLPGAHGMSLVRDLRRQVPETQIIVLSMIQDEAYVVEALRAGVAGYITKDSPVSELVHAIREAAVGRRYLSWLLAERALDAYTSADTPQRGALPSLLSRREQEVRGMLAAGRSTREIAELWAISPRTVEHHVANLMRKLGVRSRLELAACEVPASAPSDRQRRLG